MRVRVGRHNRDIFSIFFKMKTFCVFQKESPHRGNTIFHFKYNKEHQPKLTQICSFGISSYGLQNEFEVSMVNELSVLEQLKFFCSNSFELSVDFLVYVLVLLGLLKPYLYLHIIFASDSERSFCSSLLTYRLVDRCSPKIPMILNFRTSKDRFFKGVSIKRPIWFPNDICHLNRHRKPHFR